jgi:predicted nuclease of predicted toxin-antitoxin system
MKFRTIKLLTDENISPKVVAFLRQHGMNVLDTKEQQWYGKEDEELLEYAYRQQRFVFTHDSDFGTLAINEGNRYYGVVYLRLRNLRPQNVIRVCENLLALKVELFPGTILVVEDARIRIRHPE